VLAFVLIRYVISGGGTPGFPFLASIIAIFSGAQLFALGMIGEYLARMHFRLMDQPAYVVRGTTLPLHRRGRHLTEKFTIDQIREFWTTQAEQHRESPSASVGRTAWSSSWRFARWHGGSTPATVCWTSGAPTAYSTLSYAREKAITIRGVDYIPEMSRACQGAPRVWSRRWRAPRSLPVGDVLQLDEPSDAYDKVIATRVVINLHSWDAQVAPLRSARGC
jgi:hypothetical protein